MLAVTTQFNSEAVKGSPGKVHVSLATRFDHFLTQITGLIDGVARDSHGLGQLGEELAHTPAAPWKKARATNWRKSPR